MFLLFPRFLSHLVTYPNLRQSLARRYLSPGIDIGHQLRVDRHQYVSNVGTSIWIYINYRDTRRRPNALARALPSTSRRTVSSPPFISPPLPGRFPILFLPSFPPPPTFLVSVPFRLSCLACALSPSPLPPSLSSFAPPSSDYRARGRNFISL